MGSLPVGKLPADLLERLIDRYVAADPRIVVGPGIGQDVTIIQMGDRLLVAKTDPVTFATDQIGWYAVHVNANDIACSGATPRWFLATLLLPEKGATAELAETIFAQVADACRQLGVSLCGGHSEVTHGLTRPIVVGQMLGEVAPDRYVTSAGAEVGDLLILTKGIAIEGTALIANEKHAELGGLLSPARLDRCRAMLRTPGISVVRDAQLALAQGGVHALHDPTEGGVATGLWELAHAAGVGLIVDQQRLPILPDCAILCDHFGLDPLGLIGSGALLIVAVADAAPAIVKRLEAEGISANTIGRVVPAEQSCQIQQPNGVLAALPTFARDEIAGLFDGNRSRGNKEKTANER
jgi:hydrogenase expression/formation protein HypE